MEAIYAIDANNGLSKNGVIPWRSKKDMAFFMNKTRHNVVVMGRTTFFSLPEEHRPLKDRLNVVFTSNPQMYRHLYDGSNVIFTNDPTTLHMHIGCFAHQKVFIIGGKAIYEQYIPLCDKIWVTRIKREYDCDLFMEYDYAYEFTEAVYTEDDELQIIEYTRIHTSRR